ncbi:Hypothetical protein, putative [Bodo saltans]|uniref:Transmembrane protein n=1 Tax=Bodo saltans TaxID=75058 RepID=A0A0S4IYI2_BODSA|nr:Hypothetical protein, putative [Bodo saltans]|eukprot:CUG09907.1 Hypothetical protein, putative [Bodo saltans]
MDDALQKREHRLQEWEADLAAREDQLRRRLEGVAAAAHAAGPSSELKHRGAGVAPLTTSGTHTPPGTPSKERVLPLAVYVRSGKFLRSAVFGGLDGLTTSIVLICSTSGLVKSSSDGGHGDHSKGHISAAVLFTLGAANLVADAFSMGMGDFLSSLAEAEHEQDGPSTPAGHATGGGGHNAWYQDSSFVEAARNGAVMFTSFVVFGVLPLAAYAPWARMSWLTDSRRFVAACILGVLSLFTLGLLKGYVTVTQDSCGAMSNAAKWRAMMISALKMILMGSVASLISFVVSLELHTDEAH